MTTTTDTIKCGYGTSEGCTTCDEYGNDTGTPIALAVMDEPDRGSIVAVPSDPDGDEEQLGFVCFIRADNDAGLWWEPLEFGFVTWDTLLHETSPNPPELLEDPELATYVAELAIYKSRYSMVTCENCETQTMGPAVVDLARRRAKLPA